MPQTGSMAWGACVSSVSYVVIWHSSLSCVRYPSYIFVYSSVCASVALRYLRRRGVTPGPARVPWHLPSLLRAPHALHALHSSRLLLAQVRFHALEQHRVGGDGDRRGAHRQRA